MRSACIAAAIIFVLILAVLLAGLFLGRALTAGRADLIDWLPGLAAGALIYAGLGVTGMVSPWRALTLAGLIGAALAALLLSVVAAGVPVFPSARPKPAKALKVGVVTALDIAWRPDNAVPPLVQALGPGFVVTPLAHVDAAALGRVDRLLIAQPRLLQPTELVAIDDWVRSGGKALIFADPWLHWPDGPKPGDGRAAPLTSLLDPLMDHWGLTLEPADLKRESPDRRFLSDGALLILDGASRFMVGSGPCMVTEHGLFATCRLGRGSVRLVADADLLDERLWLADSDSPARSGDWAADSPALIAEWLADPLMDARKTGIPWIAEAAALRSGIRWALGFGLVWATLGGMVLAGRERLGRTGRIMGRTGQTGQMPGTKKERLKS